MFYIQRSKQTKTQNENEKPDKMKHKSVSMFGAQLAVCSAATFVLKTQINRAHNTHINRAHITQINRAHNTQINRAHITLINRAHITQINRAHNTHINRAHNTHINPQINRAPQLLNLQSSSTLKSTELINPQIKKAHQLSNQQSSTTLKSTLSSSELFLFKDFTLKTHFILKVMKMTSRQVELSTIAIKERKEEGLFVVTDSPTSVI